MTYVAYTINDNGYAHVEYMGSRLGCFQFANNGKEIKVANYPFFQKHYENRNKLI